MIEVVSPVDHAILSQTYDHMLSVRVTDADSHEDLVLTVVSDLDGHLGDFTVVQGVVTDILLSGLTVGDHVFSLSVDDGHLRGLTREEWTLHVNGAPGAAAVTSTPTQPTEGMPWSIDIEPGTDPEQEPTTISDLQWHVDGEPRVQGGRGEAVTIHPDFHQAGQVLELFVTTRDSLGEDRVDPGNIVVDTFRFEVLAHPIAEASTVSLKPAVAHPWSTMRCAVEGLEDVTYRMRWYVDGELARTAELEGPSAEDLVTRRDLPEGEVVTCEVHASNEQVSWVTVDSPSTVAERGSPGTFSFEAPYPTAFPAFVPWATDDGFDIAWVDADEHAVQRWDVQGLLQWEPGSYHAHRFIDAELDLPDLDTDHTPTALRADPGGERVYLISTGPDETVQIHIAEESVDTGDATSWSLLSEYALSAPLLGAQTYRPDPFADVALALWLGDDDSTCVRTLVGDTSSLTTTTVCQSIAPWAGPAGDFARADLDHDDTTDICLRLAGESQIGSIFDGLTWSGSSTPVSSVLTGSDETQTVMPTIGLSEGYAHDLALLRFDDEDDTLTIDMFPGGAFGSTDLPALYFIDTFTPYLRLTGWSADAARSSVHDLGDLDGDGHRELAIQGVLEGDTMQRLWLFDGGVLQTAADLALGDGSTSTLDATDAELVVQAQGVTLSPMTPATDLDGDGYPDLLLVDDNVFGLVATAHLWLSAHEALE